MMGSLYSSLGMLQRREPIRLLLTILLAIIVPFCCCDFHAWLDSCDSCDSPALSEPFTIKAATHAGCSGHPVGEPQTHELLHKASISDEKQSQDSSSQQDENQECTCAKHDAKMISGVKPTVEFSAPVILAILPWVESATFEIAGLSFKSDPFAQVFVRPSTSLLRLHCALIV